jgi:hypothetical protein
MGTIVTIIVIVGVGFGILAFIFSDEKNPKDRATNAAAVAGGGAMFAGGCLVQLIIIGLMALAGLWLISKIVR